MNATKSQSMQDRIRALAGADSNLMETEDIPIPTREEPIAANVSTASGTPSKRSSVVDMWRRREGSITSANGDSRKSVVTPRKSKTNGDLAKSSFGKKQEFAESPSYSYEEKKETTSEDNPTWSSTQHISQPAKNKNFPKAVTPDSEDANDGRQVPRQVASSPYSAAQQSEIVPSISDGSPMASFSANSAKRPTIAEKWSSRNSDDAHQSLSPEGIATSPTVVPSSQDFASVGVAHGPHTRVKVRSMWKQGESAGNTEQLPVADSFGSGVNESHSNVASNAGSYVGSPVSRNGVLDRWNKRGCQEEILTANQAPSSPVVRAVDLFSKPPPNAPESPAFKDLKSRWAKFGGNKEQARDTRKTPEQVGPSPRARKSLASPKVASEAKQSPPSSKSLCSKGLHSGTGDESSIDGGKMNRVAPSKASPKPKIANRIHDNGSNIEQCGFPQGPALDVDNDGFPRLRETVMSKKNPPTPQKNLMRKMGQQHTARPKPATSTESGNHMHPPPQDDAIPISVQSGNSAMRKQDCSSVSRPSPRKFAQRRQLLEKHRKRNKSGSGQPSGESLASPTDDGRSCVDNTFVSDPLSEAFQDTVSDDQRQELSVRLAWAQSSAPRSEAMVGASITMQTLLAYGADEDGFIGAEFGSGKAFQGPSEYSSFLFSDSNSFSKSDISKFRPLKASSQMLTGQEELSSNAGISLEDPLSVVGSHASTSVHSNGSIADRAQKTLRDKRNKNRGVSLCTDPATHPSDSQNNRYSDQRDLHRAAMYTAPEDYKHPIAPLSTGFGGDIFPVDEHPGTASPPTSRHKKVENSQMTYQSQTSATEDSPTFDSETVSIISNMVSTITSEGTSSKSKRMSPRTPTGGDLSVPAESIVTDQFVSESNANVEAFRNSLSAMSFGQMANDLKDEVTGTVMTGVDLTKLSTGLNEGMAAASQSLNANMAAASQSLNKLVGSDLFPGKKQDPLPRGTSPVEEIAIEVEYVEDSEEEGEI